MTKNYTEEEINQLVTEYRPLVGAVIRKKMLYNLADYDDVFQTGLIGLWMGLKAFDYDQTGTKLSTFLFTTIYRKINGDYRTAMRHQPFERKIDSIEKLIERTGNPSAIDTFYFMEDVEVNNIDHLLYTESIEYFKNLKDKTLSNMVLRYYQDGLNYVEIAEEFGLTRQNTTMRINNAVKRYRKYLVKSGVFTKNELGFN